MGKKGCEVFRVEFGRPATYNRGMEMQERPLSFFDPVDERFRVSRTAPDSRLEQSIRAHGVVSPLAAVWRADRPVLLCGWRRLDVCRELGLSSIPVRMFDIPDNITAFDLAVGENLSLRGFDFLEKADILDRYAGFGLHEKALLRDICPRLSIPSSRRYLDVYLKAARGGEELRRFAAEHNPDLPAVRALLELKEDVYPLLFPILSRLSRNKRVELLDHLLETSRRDELTPRDLLSSGDIRSVEDNPNLSDRQKAEEIRRILRMRRLPALTARAALFLEMVKNAQPPESLKFEPSPFFEEDRIRISFEFGTIGEFENILSSLSSLPGSPAFGALLETFGETP